MILPRHGKSVAATVSMLNLKRIWQQQDEQDKGEIWHPLYHILHNRNCTCIDLEIGRGGKIVLKSEAALQLRTLQLNRADKRRILREGGLEPVEGGDLMEERPWWARKVWRKRWW